VRYFKAPQNDLAEKTSRRSPTLEKDRTPQAVARPNQYVLVVVASAPCAFAALANAEFSGLLFDKTAVPVHHVSTPRCHHHSVDVGPVAVIIVGDSVESWSRLGFSSFHVRDLLAVAHRGFPPQISFTINIREGATRFHVKNGHASVSWRHESFHEGSISARPPVFRSRVHPTAAFSTRRLPLPDNNPWQTLSHLEQSLSCGRPRGVVRAGRNRFTAPADSRVFHSDLAPPLRHHSGLLELVVCDRIRPEPRDLAADNTRGST